MTPAYTKFGHNQKLYYKSLKKIIRHTISDTLYVYIKLLWTTFSLGPCEARSNLLKACLSIKISPLTEKIYLIQGDPIYSDDDGSTWGPGLEDVEWTKQIHKQNINFWLALLSLIRYMVLSDLMKWPQYGSQRKLVMWK